MQTDIHETFKHKLLLTNLRLISTNQISIPWPKCQIALLKNLRVSCLFLLSFYSQYFSLPHTHIFFDSWPVFIVYQEY